MPKLRLREITNEKQTCAICIRAIRRDTARFHQTECPQPHFFHESCWNNYRTSQQGRALKCPTCRHAQSSEAERPQGCALCLRREPEDPVTAQCGHVFCDSCFCQHARNAAAGNVSVDCPQCRRTLVDPRALVSYLFLRQVSQGPLPRLAEQMLGRFRSGYLMRKDLMDFCLDETSYLLLAPEQGGEEDELLACLVGLTQDELSDALRNCTAMEDWNEHLDGEDFPCAICLQPVDGTEEAYVTDCFPAEHRFHRACWEGFPEHMRMSCRVCGQQTLQNSTLSAVTDLFDGEIGEDGVVPELGRQIIERYITGAVSVAELKRWCFADCTRRAFGQAPVQES